MTDVISSIPSIFWLLLLVEVIIGGCVVLYALYCKGDFLLEASHRGSSFRLQAKERPSKKSG
jgi:hypothetical protein